MKPPHRNWSLRDRLTAGVLVLSAIGFGGAGITSQFLLRTYLIGQVDDQLNSVIGGTASRVNEAGIVSDEESNLQYSESSEDSRKISTAPVAPLNRVPTSISVTLLDPFGNLIGGIGGDLNSHRITDYVKGLLPNQVVAFGEKPFTIATPGADFRVVTRVLPSATGSIVVAQSLADFDRTTNRIGRVFLFIGIIVLLLIGFAARQMIKFSMKPLEAVQETAERIAAGDLSARLENVEPDTEVGRLSASLNTMLGQIEESFALRTESEEKLRRFIADASHELRTPLTAIRGFAELHRQGAVPAGAKTKELIGRIEQESIRMGALVEDLLLLARLDQARQMEFQPVDLVHVIAEVVASATAAGPAHPITVVMPPELYTLGDSGRIYQVFTNLLANARVHTPAGTTITITAKSEEGGALITIADNGPGLSGEDQKKIFERLFRADPSRQRSNRAGSGLGLSIVDAVMAAHGGRVEVSSKPGLGATFTLFFPNAKA